MDLGWLRLCRELVLDELKVVPKAGRDVSSWWQESGSQGWAFPSDPAEVIEARMRRGKAVTVLGLQLPSCSSMGFAPERGERVSAQPWAQRRGGGVSVQVPVVILQKSD